MIDESERQHLSAHHYLGGPDHDSALQNSVDLTARHFGFPIVALNILDRTHQHTVAAHGAPQGIVPRTDALCDNVVRSGRPWMAHDLDHQWGSTTIRTYIGVPLTGREGLPIAALCLIDDRPGRCSDADLDELVAAATVIQDQLELRRLQNTTNDTTPARSAAISAAVENGEITPWLQPIFELGTGSLTAVEALARWQRPDGRVELPASFLAEAETSDVIIDLDLAVLGSASRTLAGWRGHPDLALNVNLSTRHLGNPDCVDRLTACVVDAGLTPDRVNLEITETTVLNAGPEDAAFLDALHHRGFHVLLDDFGTGFSSIAHVLRLPIDGIKIDRTVTQTLDSRAGNAVVRALTRLADELDLDVCIEGVETPEQAALATRLGCRYGQGFLWAAPVPAADFLPSRPVGRSGSDLPSRTDRRSKGAARPSMGTERHRPTGRTGR